MADPARMLDALRDIHVPVGGDSGPILTMILIGCAAAIALTLALRPRLRRWGAVRRSALEVLAGSRSLEPAERLAAQAVLLRRLVRTIDGDTAARLQGAAWLDCLDRLFATHFFTEGEGRNFGEALYRPHASQDVDALDASLARLFARISR
jgi:hypothetical protein